MLALCALLIPSSALHVLQSTSRHVRHVPIPARFTTNTKLCSMSTDSLEGLNFREDSVVAVSTCSRGIGLEFARQILEHTSARVIGLHRPSSNCQRVSQLEAQYGENRIQLVELDLQDHSSIEKAGEEIRSRFNRVDLLLNVAGILGDGGKTPETPGPERSIMNMDREWLSKTFEVNLFGHVMLTKELWPLLRYAGNRKHSETTSSRNNEMVSTPSKVVMLSARVGSISDNRLGGWYSYRMSKAAVNMFTKTLSLEGKRFNCAVIALHPGTVDTDLSVPFQGNVAADKLFTVEHSVQQMLHVIATKANDCARDSGKVYAYDGTEIPF